jgi:hypothetical protein
MDDVRSEHNSGVGPKVVSIVTRDGSYIESNRTCYHTAEDTVDYRHPGLRTKNLEIPSFA